MEEAECRKPGLCNLCISELKCSAHYHSNHYLVRWFCTSYSVIFLCSYNHLAYTTHSTRLHAHALRGDVPRAVKVWIVQPSGCEGVVRPYLTRGNRQYADDCVSWALPSYSQATRLTLFYVKIQVQKT